MWLISFIAKVLQLSRDVAPAGIEWLEFLLNCIVRGLIYFTSEVFTKSVNAINFGSVSGTFFAFYLQQLI